MNGAFERAATLACYCAEKEIGRAFYVSANQV